MNQIDNIILFSVCNIAIAAGKKIMEHYDESSEVFTKKDSSPLTNADLNSNTIILERLNMVNDDIPVLSEESMIEWKIRKLWKRYWLVDPLDGTKEFIKKNGEFTVNIALIENNIPIIGVIYVPAKKIIYFAKKNFGSYKLFVNSNSINLKSAKILKINNHQDIIKVIGSRSHTNKKLNEWLEKNFKNFKIIQKGSSLKFCEIAEGNADIYPRFGPTSEWDIAAGHIILKEAGGEIKTFDNKDIKYNLKESLLNPEFIAYSKYKFKI